MSRDQQRAMALQERLLERVEVVSKYRIIMVRAAMQVVPTIMAWIWSSSEAGEVNDV